MKRNGVLILAILCLAVTVMPSADVSKLQTGEKWIYEHKGPRPGGWNQDDVSGERTREVVSIKGEGDEKRWVVRESFGANDEMAGDFILNAKGKIVRREFGPDRGMDFEPPLPMDFISGKVGEEKKYETTLSFGQGSAPFSIVSKRVDDETLKLPAGEFENCQHYKNVITITFSRDGNEMKMETKQEIWFHPKANGIVKEVYSRDATEFGGQTREGYTATSVLKSHTKK